MFVHLLQILSSPLQVKVRAEIRYVGRQNVNILGFSLLGCYEMDILTDVVHSR